MAETMIGIKPLHDRLLVGIYDSGETTMMIGGKKFYLLSDTSAGMDRNVEVKHPGIRPRWAIVLAVPDELVGQGVSVGDKVLLDELKWSRGINAGVNEDGRGNVWSIPFEDILLVGSSDEFTDSDREQIVALYPDWEKWDTVSV